MELRVGERSVGDGHPTFLIAEVGLNHNGSIERAHELIDAASQAGADCVKFQNYRTDEFLSSPDLEWQYVDEVGNVRVESQYDMFKRYELPKAWLADLKAHCDERGVIFLCTPMSRSALEELTDIGVVALKNGSDSLGNLLLLRAMARTGLPTFVSTGMASLGDIEDAVNAFRSAGTEAPLVLMLCTSAYPTPPQDVNLFRMRTLAGCFSTLVGFSDHTEGTTAAIAAVALGACCVEKHFTLNKFDPGPDHRFSADPLEFQTLVSSVRFVEHALGTTTFSTVPSEAAVEDAFVLSCVAACSISAGTVLREDLIAFHRKGRGLRAKDADKLIGRVVQRDLEAFETFSLSDFSDANPT